MKLKSVRNMSKWKLNTYNSRTLGTEWNTNENLDESAIIWKKPLPNAAEAFDIMCILDSDLSILNIDINHYPLLFRSFLLQLTSEPFLSKQSCFIIDGLLPNKWDTEKLHSRTQYTGTSYISPMTSFTPINSISMYQTASLDSKDIISITENLILHTSYTVG